MPTPKQRDGNPLEFGYYLQDLLAKAEAATKKNDHQAAIRYYRALAASIPNQAQGWSKLCEAYEAARDRQRALGACKYAIDREGAELKDFTRFVDLMVTKPDALLPEERTAVNDVLAHLDKQPDLAVPAAHLRCKAAVKMNDERRPGGMHGGAREGRPGRSEDGRVPVVAGRDARAARPGGAARRPREGDGRGDGQPRADEQRDFSASGPAVVRVVGRDRAGRSRRSSSRCSQFVAAACRRCGRRRCRTPKTKSAPPAREARFRANSERRRYEATAAGSRCPSSGGRSGGGCRPGPGRSSSLLIAVLTIAVVAARCSGPSAGCRAARSPGRRAVRVRRAQAGEAHAARQRRARPRSGSATGSRRSDPGTS